MLSPEELGEGPPGALVPCPRSQSWTPVEATSSTSAALSQILLEVTESPSNLGQGNGVGGGAGEGGQGCHQMDGTCIALFFRHIPWSL